MSTKLANPPTDLIPSVDDMNSIENDHQSITDSADTLAEFREQDRLLPIANVGRIMKLAVPPSAKISKEAKESVQECVSEFISFVSSEYVIAHHVCVGLPTAASRRRGRRSTAKTSSGPWSS